MQRINWRRKGLNWVIPQRRWVLEFFIVAVAVGLWAGAPLLAGSAAMLLMLALAADWLARRSYATLALSYHVGRAGVALGDTADVWLTVENPEPWPLTTVHFEEVVPEGLEVAAPVPPGLQRLIHGSMVSGALFVGAHERVRYRLTVAGAARGRWQIGPARVWSGDPLGWARFEQHSADRAVVTVYPRRYPVPPGLVASTRPQGERRGPPWNPPDPLRVAGIRPYQPGAPPRLIHPHATARTGTLQVKRLEPEGDAAVELVALAASAPFLWEGIDPALFEAVVSAAASVADRHLREGSAVGLSLVGSVYGAPRGVHLAATRGPQQWARVMTALAWVQPGGGQGHDLTPTLTGLARRLRPGAQLVVLACFHRPGWDTPLRQLVQRGVPITFVPVGPDAGAPQLAGVRVHPWTPAEVAP